MANDFPQHMREASRVTVMAHQRLDERILESFRALGIKNVFAENARCVRQRARSRLLGLPGLRVKLSDSPVELFRATVPRGSAEHVVHELAKAVDLYTPGRGSVYAQDLREIPCNKAPAPEPAEAPHTGSGRMLRNFTLITGILSMSGSGENLSRIALKLGAGVPVLSLGTGTGIRDRLGLLRITIPAEKELVYLMVPSHDAEGVLRLLIEGGHLDRPGGGFLYQTPIRAGVVDPLIRIGRQEHAASIEQIIAAMDDMKKGTEWRKRFTGMEYGSGKKGPFRHGHREITFVCSDGRGDAFVREAMRAGAQGATISRVRCLNASDDVKSRTASRERGIICIPRTQEEPVLNALGCAAEAGDEQDWNLQILEAPTVFFHKRH